MPLLEVCDLETGYRAVPALSGVDLDVQEGEWAVLLGLNGSGKTTTLLTIAGLLPAWGGEVRLGGRSLEGVESHERVRRGIVLVPEGRRVFPDLMVGENLRLGAWPRRRASRRVEKILRVVFDLFPILYDRRAQLAGTLGAGEQQMLAIGRGLMAGPRLLLIDEASLGLPPRMVTAVFTAIRRIRDEGVTVLMAEQNAGALADVDQVLVMQKGRVVYAGSPDEIVRQKTLRQAYFGAPA